MKNTQFHLLKNTNILVINWFLCFVICLCLINRSLTACGEGKYYMNDSSECQVCPAGTFSLGGDARSCQDCPPGTWNWFYQAENRVSCSGCGNGRFLNNNKNCETCDQGTFNDQEIAESCKPCPEGTWNWYYQSNNRISCSGCGKGRYMVGNKLCSDCPPGEYSTQEIATTCTKVPPGYKYTNIESDPKPCGEGFYSSGSRTDCMACPNNNCESIQMDTSTENKIKLMISYAEYAYDYGKSSAEPSLSNMKLIQNDSKDSQAIIGYDQALDSIVISYRGTYNLSNIISDAKFLKDPLTDLIACSGCKVHTGFKSGFDSLEIKMQEDLKSIQDLHSNAKIIVTGHSYGGALASLKAISLEKSGYKVSLITFGSPRVGNDEFSEYANKHITGDNIRVTYQDDPVISIPPTSLSFKHLGTEIQFYNKKEYYLFPKNFDRQNNVDSTSFYDHSSYWDINKGSGVQTDLQLIME